MHVVVCVKQTPDSAAKITVSGGSVSWGDAGLVVNPWDEYAIEEAIRLKEKHGGKATALCLGPESAKEALKTCLAMGCDEAILISDSALNGSDAAKARFIHRQTMASAMRFTTTALAELETGIASAADRALAIELAVFDRLAQEAVGEAEHIAAGAEALAVLDVSAALARLALAENYCRPVVEGSLAFEVSGGRLASARRHRVAVRLPRLPVCGRRMTVRVRLSSSLGRSTVTRRIRVTRSRCAKPRVPSRTSPRHHRGRGSR